jgi:hypothetical protein
MVWSGTPLTPPSVGTPVAAAQGVIVAADLNALGSAWTSYNPTLTAASGGVNLGSGASVGGGYLNFGKTCIGWAKVNFGTSGTAAGSGLYAVALPLTLAAHWAFQDIIGTARIKCAGVVTRCDLVCYATSTAAGGLLYTSAAVNGTLTMAGNASPGAWTANDSIDISFCYDTA